MTKNDSPGPQSRGPLPEQPQIHDSMLDLIGNTPLVRLHSLAPETGAELVAKVEYFNPGGSVKDRIAVRMIDAAERMACWSPAGPLSSRPAAIPASAWQWSPNSAATRPSLCAPTR
jgi:threonine synthase